MINRFVFSRSVFYVLHVFTKKKNNVYIILRYVIRYLLNTRLKNPYFRLGNRNIFFHKSKPLI
jgi:hypothetical protein